MGCEPSSIRVLTLCPFPLHNTPPIEFAWFWDGVWLCGRAEGKKQPKGTGVRWPRRGKWGRDTKEPQKTFCSSEGDSVLDRR